MIRVLLPGLFCLLIVSCSREKPVAPREAPVYVGIIDQVYINHNYVLVRLGTTPPAEGTVLISQAPAGEENGRVANLVVSAERLDSLRVPADIRSGSVKKGDLVFLYKNLAPPAANDMAPGAEPIIPQVAVKPDRPPAIDEEQEGQNIAPPSVNPDKTLQDMLDSVEKTYGEATKQ